MTTDTTQARKMIEQFIKINPATDRIVQGDGRHLSNLQVDAQGLECTEYIDEDGQTESENNRLRRRIRAFDARNRELEQELKQKDADYTGVAMEYQDLADENRRLKQELEIKTVVADARDATIRELRAELNTAKALAAC